jgi:tape measure domain-containing protein
MIIGDMEIRLRADIARLQRDMDSARQVVGNATAGMERAANAAKGAIASIAGALGVQQLGRMVDEYAKFTSQLKLATTSQREYAAAYTDVKRIATQSTQGLMETGILYARIANGTRELGVEQKKVSQIVETVNLALVVSGAAASESASAQLQLSQAFASGTLRGEEFNAVNESAPRLMKALADGMGLPVGALKKMAEEGKITSKIMADVLPAALEKLRVEAKEIQTISGAFTVLRNNVMEFVGIQANASGAVSGLVSVIGLLSSNLGLLAGVITTLGVSKLVTMFQSWGVATYKQIADNNALRTSTLAGAVASTEAASVIAAAKLAEAQANVRTAATAANLATARVAELRSSVLAAEGAVALAIATNGLIPAQARAIALSEAHALALAGQAVAANGATVSAGAASAALTAQAAATGVAARSMGVLRGAMMFMGGPIGTIITLLGLAATAWMVWGNKSKEATEKAAESFDEAQVRIIKGLDEQIDKNEKLLKLRNLGVTKSDAEKQLPFVNQLAAASERLNQINMRAGAFAGKSNTDIEFARIGVLRDITDLTEKMAKAESTGAAVAAQSVDERVKAFKKEHATKQEQMAAELKAIEDLKGKTAEYGEMERRIREKYADKGVAQGIKAEATAYQNLVTSIREKAAANELELSGYDKLSESQKMTMKLDEAIATGKNKLTPAHVAETRALIAKVAAQESAIEEGAFYLQQAEQQAQLSAAAIKAADDEADRNEELARTLGMSKVAIEKMTLARLEEKLAQADASKGYTREIMELEAVIDAKKRNVKAMGELEGMEALQKATEKARADQVQLWNSIEKTAHDTFISIFDSGKSAFDRLKDALKNGLYELLYQMTVKKWLINISPTTTGATAGSGLAGLMQGTAGSAGSGSTALDLISTGKKIYDGFATGFASVGSTLGGYVSALGSTFGSASVSAFGAGMGMTGSQAATAAAAYNGAGMTGVGSSLTAGSAVGAAAGVAAGVAGGVYGGRLISGGYSAFGGSGNSAVNTGTAVGAAVGSIVPVLGTALGALIGGVIGGSVNRLFGHKAKEIVEQGISGNFGTSGFSGGQEYSKWTQKGGVFRSDKSGTETAALSSEMNKALTDGFTLVKDTTLDFAKTLGVSADVVTGYSKQLKLVLTKDAAQNQELLSKLFTDIGDEIATRIVPSIAQFKIEGETASATLQRLTGNFQVVDAMLVTLGVTSQQAFNTIGVASIEARERLIGMAGGIDALAAQTQFYADNFLTKAEQIAPVQKQLNDQLSALGYAGMTTSDQFKVAVQGLVASGALATERGAEQYAGLLALGPQFKVFADHLKEIGDAAESLAVEKLRLSIQIMELEGNAVGALNARRAQELASVDESLRPHYQRIYALQDEKTAMDAATQAAQAATQAVRDAATSLLAGVDSSFSVLQSIVSREKAAVQSSIDAHTESVSKLQSLSQALRGTLDSIQSPEQKLASRANGQAQISAALAIARAGGPLPGADSLKDALSAVQQDASDQFSSYTDYLRDLYRTQNDIGALAGLTDAQLSVEEKALQATRDQLAALEAQLASTQALIEAAKGQSTTLLSIDQGIAAVRAAILAAQANPVVAATSAINSAYQTHLGRAPDAAGLEWWKDAAASGTPVSQIVSGIAGSAEADLNKLYQSVLGRAPDAEGLAFWMKAYGPTMDAAEKADFLKAAQPELQGKKIPGFANGGDFSGGVRAVGEVGVEIEATGPSRIHSTQSLMDALRRPPSNNNDGLAAAVERLSATVERQNAVIERQGAALEQIQRNTRRQADTLDVVTEGGNGMRVTGGAT